METQKKTPHPGLFSWTEQGMRPGSYCFWGPGDPITNLNSERGKGEAGRCKGDTGRLA